LTVITGFLNYRIYRSLVFYCSKLQNPNPNPSPKPEFDGVHSKPERPKPGFNSRLGLESIPVMLQPSKRLKRAGKN